MRKWMLLLAVVAGALAGGCVGDSTIEQRQNAAMKDPFNYSPYDEKIDAGSSRPKSSGLQRDVNSVFNP